MIFHDINYSTWSDEALMNKVLELNKHLNNCYGNDLLQYQIMVMLETVQIEQHDRALKSRFDMEQKMNSSSIMIETDPSMSEKPTELESETQKNKSKRPVPFKMTKTPVKPSNNK